MFGETPLCFAARSGEPETVSFLLDQGVDESVCVCVCVCFSIDLNSPPLKDVKSALAVAYLRCPEAQRRMNSYLEMGPLVKDAAKI